jgi:hypothetical protein
MKNISFFLTTPQFKACTKTVTRRMGWRNLKAVEKAQGLKKGEQITKIGIIEVTKVSREPLKAITKEDIIKEGFPEMDPSDFVLMFCSTHQHCEPKTIITRIEYKYL